MMMMMMMRLLPYFQAQKWFFFGGEKGGNIFVHSCSIACHSRGRAAFTPEVTERLQKPVGRNPIPREQLLLLAPGRVWRAGKCLTEVSVPGWRGNFPRQKYLWVLKCFLLLVQMFPTWAEILGFYRQRISFLAPEVKTHFGDGQEEGSEAINPHILALSLCSSEHCFKNLYWLVFLFTLAVLRCLYTYFSLFVTAETSKQLCLPQGKEVFNLTAATIEPLFIFIFYFFTVIWTGFILQQWK